MMTRASKWSAVTLTTADATSKPPILRPPIYDMRLARLSGAASSSVELGEERSITIAPRAKDQYKVTQVLKKRRRGTGHHRWRHSSAPHSCMLASTLDALRAYLTRLPCRPAIRHSSNPLPCRPRVQAPQHPPNIPT